MASRTTTDPLEILLEMGVDLDNLSGEEDYLSALMEAAATIEFLTKGSGDERSAALRKEIIEVRNKRKAADPNFKAKTAKISKSSFKSKAKLSGVKSSPSSALVPYQKPAEESVEESKTKKKTAKVDKNDKLLSSILKNVISIKGLIKERLNVTKSIRDIERKNLQKKKRKAKEDSLEKDKKGKGFLKKLKGALPQLSIFDAIFNWIKNVVIGKILIKIIDWMSDPKNKKKLDTLGRFLKDWWPALTAAFVLFATPLGSFIRIVVSGMARLTSVLLRRAIPALISFAARNPIATAAILATGGAVAMALKNEGMREEENKKDNKNIVTPTETREKGQTPSGSQLMDEMTRQRGFGGMFSNGGEVPSYMKPMGTDTIPAMLSPGEFVMSSGAVDKFGSSFMESINAAGGGTNKPKIVSGTTYAQGGGGILVNNAKTTYYDPAQGGINASGYKTADGLPATSTGEGYKPEVFSAAAFPPLLKLLPKEMTVPTSSNFPGGRTLKQPFQVLVTKGDKSAVVRVNDVGPGVSGHADNHMLDFSVAAKNYLGTGEGYQIHLVKNNAKLGPTSKGFDTSTIKIDSPNKSESGSGLENWINKTKMGSNEEYNIPGVGNYVRGKNWFGGGQDKLFLYPGAAGYKAPSPNYLTGEDQSDILLSIHGSEKINKYLQKNYPKIAPKSSDTDLSSSSNTNNSGSNGGNSGNQSKSNTENKTKLDFSSLKGTGAFDDMFASQRAELSKSSGQVSSLTPLPVEKISPTERLKRVSKSSTDTINMPPLESGVPPTDSGGGNVPSDPDFPTVSPSKLSREVRATVIENTLGGYS